MRSKPEKQTLTPPELAALWGISPHRVLQFIRSGELRAINLASRRGGRPRYAIPLDAKLQFEQSRQAVPDEKPAPARSKKDPNVREYF